MLGSPHLSDRLYRRTTRRVVQLHCLCGLALSVLFTFNSHPAVGWWNHGHSLITAGAIGHLSQPLQVFFEQYGDFLSERSASEPPGSHWIHMDDYPSFFTGTFPRVYDEVVALHGESYVQEQGTVPWTFVAYVELLTDQMAAAVDVDDWIELLDTAAAQAHYIEDLHNPFHLTKNYNGQFTGNDGIHARYEGEMIVRHLDELTFSPSNAAYLPSVLDFVFDGIDIHFPHVEDVLAADDLYAGLSTEEYYTGMWNETGTLTQVLFQQASEAVANSWYTAWINAGSPTTFLADNADLDDDGDIDGQDFLTWQHDPSVGDLSDWQANFGTTSDAIAASTSVPEPNAIFLFATGNLFLSRRRSYR